MNGNIKYNMSVEVTDSVRPERVYLPHGTLIMMHIYKMKSGA